MSAKESNRKIIKFTPETYKSLQMLELNCEVSQDDIINHLLARAGKVLLGKLYHGEQVNLSDLAVVFQSEEGGEALEPAEMENSDEGEGGGDLTKEDQKDAEGYKDS